MEPILESHLYVSARRKPVKHESTTLKIVDSGADLRGGGNFVRGVQAPHGIFPGWGRIHLPPSLNIDIGSKLAII